jgi:hypothetical protein
MGRALDWSTWIAQWFMRSSKTITLYIKYSNPNKNIHIWRKLHMMDTQTRCYAMQIYDNCYWVTALQTNMFPWQQLNYNNEEQCFVCGPCRGVVSRSLQFSQLWQSLWSVRAWTRKMRKLWCWKPLPGDNWWRYSRLRRLSACCSELQGVN